MEIANDELRIAINDIQRYLLDQIPPLTASEALETLMHQPPQLLMQQVHAWSVEQSRVQGVGLVDCLFHALRKVQMFGMLKLVDRKALDIYLESIIPLALQLVPPNERELLRTNLVAMRAQQILGVTEGADTIHRASIVARISAGPSNGHGSAAPSQTARRLSLMIDRLAKSVPVPAGSSAPSHFAASQQVPGAGQLLTIAASNASTEEELKNYLETLRPYAGAVEVASVIKALASAIPSWEFNVPASSTMKPAPSSSVTALHKVVSLTKNSMEVAKRLRELMMSAVEQFNAGSLGAAISMLEVADVVIVEKKIDPSSVERIRADAVDTISSTQLKKFTENRGKHPLLRKFLSAFPALKTDSLLQQLRGEEKPERRRALLALLEAWGTEGRGAALHDLESELRRPHNEIDTYYLRNVIYLLHRIARDDDSTVDKEVDLLTRATLRGHSIYVIKEAVLPLGQIKTDASVKLLTTRLAEFETMLLRGEKMYPPEEMQKILDRIITALAKIGTPAALLTVARHGMKPNPLLGDTRARIAALSQHDLSFDGQTVAILVNAIREDLPNKLLGRYLPKRQPPPVRLIEALSSTRCEEVESLFSELSQKFPDHEVGRAAAAALATLTAGEKQTTDRSSALTGDLQFFGLPSLMQSLAETQATGIVTLTAKPGAQTAGKILFVSGGFVDAQAGPLRGVDAMYQLLERPVVGTFSFVPQPSIAARNTTPPADVTPIIFEGIRRYDELKQMSLLVTDGLVLKPTNMKPAFDPEERDVTLTGEVWKRAVSGHSVAEWEPQVAADSYRVRRLVGKWLEEGALTSA